jgi:hypothetical protein
LHGRQPAPAATPLGAAAANLLQLYVDSGAGLLDFQLMGSASRRTGK